MVKIFQNKSTFNAAFCALRWVSFKSPLFLCSQIINPFLNSMISANQDNGWNFNQLRNPYTLIIVLVKNFFYMRDKKQRYNVNCFAEVKLTWISIFLKIIKDSYLGDILIWNFIVKQKPFYEFINDHKKEGEKKENNIIMHIDNLFQCL